MTVTPSQLALDTARAAGGRLEEADLHALLSERHSTNVARWGIEFAVTIHGTLVREQIGPVTMIVVAQEAARV